MYLNVHTKGFIYLNIVLLKALWLVIAPIEYINGNMFTVKHFMYAYCL